MTVPSAFRLQRSNPELTRGYLTTALSRTASSGCPYSHLPLLRKRLPTQTGSHLKAWCLLLSSGRTCESRVWSVKQKFPFSCLSQNLKKRLLVTVNKIHKKKGKYRVNREVVMKRLAWANTVSNRTSPACQFLCPSPCELSLTYLNFI